MFRNIFNVLGTIWERLLFALVGAICLGFAFRFLILGQVTNASAVIAMAFFSFFYSNLARFKKFKGLGFEAELWEDKQKEAANLIDRLKSVVSVYTREIVLNSVMRGRWGGSGSAWRDRWSLFDELVAQHNQLGQEIDFSSLKAKVDSIFLFDLCMPLYQSIQHSIDDAKSQADKNIRIQFGSPITDSQGYGEALNRLTSITARIEDPFERSQSENLPKLILDLANSSASGFEREFSIPLQFKSETMSRLNSLAQIAEQRPIEVTNQLIEWADGKSAGLDA